MKDLLEKLVSVVKEQEARILELEKTVEKQEDLMKDLYFRYREIIELIEH